MSVMLIRFFMRLYIKRRTCELDSVKIKTIEGYHHNV